MRKNIISFKFCKFCTADAVGITGKIKVFAKFANFGHFRN